MTDIAQLLRNNAAWAERMERDYPGFFRKLERQHKPKFLWIGCADSRVPADQLTGVMPGEVFVHRNIANQIINTDMNLMCVLQYAIDVLRVEHIIVCGHSRCGGIEAVMRGTTPGVLDHWLESVRRLVEAHPEADVDDIAQLNVRHGVEALAHNVLVRRAWSRGRRLFLHGWFYSIANGRLQDLGVSRGPHSETTAP
jgi:carbonic anhydrase